ncbi:MAG: hypothetical protein KBT19_01430 [Lachnospiraceae bacterium]|nr:hypothetical protein [Candidatus Colinaster equi]
MSNVLKQLFEFQKYEANAHLDKVINSVQETDMHSLSDEDLTLINAGQNIPCAKQDKKDGNRD